MRRALWSSLIGKYGEKGLKINVRTTAAWIAWAAPIALLFLISTIKND